MKRRHVVQQSGRPSLDKVIEGLRPQGQGASTTERMVTRFFYHISYHWMVPSPKGGARSGFADVILWFGTPMNHPVKINALKVTLAHMMEVQHTDENGAAIVGLPDEFKYPKITLVSWNRIMEDRVPESKAKEKPPVPKDVLAELVDVTDKADPIAAMSHGNAPRPAPTSAPAPVADAPGVLGDSSPLSAADTGTNVAPPPEDQEPQTRSEGPAVEGEFPQQEPESPEPEPDNLRPFRGKVNFPSEEDK